MRFTSKDAVLTLTLSMVAQADEDHFYLMRRDLKSQFETAKEYVPGLKEFIVSVTDPDWVSKEQ